MKSIDIKKSIQSKALGNLKETSIADVIPPGKSRVVDKLDEKSRSLGCGPINSGMAKDIISERNRDIEGEIRNQEAMEVYNTNCLNKFAAMIPHFRKIDANLDMYIAANASNRNVLRIIIGDEKKAITDLCIELYDMPDKKKDPNVIDDLKDTFKNSGKGMINDLKGSVSLSNLGLDDLKSALGCSAKGLEDNLKSIKEKGTSSLSGIMDKVKDTLSSTDKIEAELQGIISPFKKVVASKLSEVTANAKYIKNNILSKPCDTIDAIKGLQSDIDPKKLFDITSIKKGAKTKLGSELKDISKLGGITDKIDGMSNCIRGARNEAENKLKKINPFGRLADKKKALSSTLKSKADAYISEVTASKKDSLNLNKIKLKPAPIGQSLKFDGFMGNKVEDARSLNNFILEYCLDFSQKFVYAERNGTDGLQTFISESEAMHDNIIANIKAQCAENYSDIQVSKENKADLESYIA